MSSKPVIPQVITEIADDIKAGRERLAICRDYGIHQAVYSFIRKTYGIQKRRASRVAESRIREVFDYTFDHTIRQTAEHFKVSKTTVSNYIRLACGGKR